jgi:NAD(P)-dependent dehydrogenase (short-subunit alcohol dehydrogenase family)
VKAINPSSRRSAEHAPGHFSQPVGGSGKLPFGGPPLLHAYTASKQAPLGLSESLELELRRNGEKIGVSLIGAGFVRTNMSDFGSDRLERFGFGDGPA